MPRLANVVPKYRNHKSSGQAVVTLGGVDHYLGHYGTNYSREAYDRLVGEWLARGRRPEPSSFAPQPTVNECLRTYWDFVQKHYRKPSGHRTSESENIRAALRPLRERYGRTDAATFGPLALKALRQAMVERGLCRNTINARIDRIKRFFKWCVSEELVPPAVYEALRSVAGLQRGRSDARESQPVRPVPDSVIEGTLPHLSRAIADMVRFQRLTGCRPAEACQLKPGDLDRTAAIWKYTPADHKTAWRGMPRVVLIGPKAQTVLSPYLLRPSDAYCFSPADSERKRKEELRARRRSRVQPSQADRSKAQARRKPRACYDTNTYLNAVRRAALKAGVPSWSPNRLRHTAATEIRARFGLEAAQVVLGHATADVSQIYAERDLERAAAAMKAVG